MLEKNAPKPASNKLKNKFINNRITEAIDKIIDSRSIHRNKRVAL